MKKPLYACKYGPTRTRKCLVAFSGNGKNICRLFELGICNYDKNGKAIDAQITKESEEVK